jgi:hypothetical protein
LINATSQSTSGSTFYPVFLSTAGAAVTPQLDDDAGSPTAGLRYVPATGTLTSAIFAGTASSARYADLAERYLSDQNYDPGTVMEFGGANEVTISQHSHSTRVAGAVSTAPAYEMNTGLEGKHVVAIALTGRIPCQVVGTICKGDLLVSSDIPGVATVLNLENYQPGCVLGKALEDYDSKEVGTITVVVGKT